MFHRILVAVDDSQAAREALVRAVELVEAGHGRLGLLSSAPKPPPLAPGPVALPVSQRQLEEDLLSWAQSNVEEAARQVPTEIPVTKLVTRGAPGRALLRQANTGCWDLIVVGQSHRRFHVRRVGDWLNRRSPTPVLVVHEEPDTTPRRRGTGLLGRFSRGRRAQVKPA
jgi:nucleotide-binding universal stress UspA family protein